jgi:glycerol dehydrogenase-like iron-containing ADH family enzyme
VVQALVTAHSIRKDRFTILGMGLTTEAAEKIAEITQVI